MNKSDSDILSYITKILTGEITDHQIGISKKKPTVEPFYDNKFVTVYYWYIVKKGIVTSHETQIKPLFYHYNFVYENSDLEIYVKYG